MMNHGLQRTEQTTTPASSERTRNRRADIPLTDIYETPAAIVVLANMPGVSEANVNITLEQNVLTIEGVADPLGNSGYNLIYEEFAPTDFRRVFNLSTDVERDAISASVKDGVLKLTLPKAEPARARKIEVRAG